ncbi:glycosyltransferase family 17 [Cordyceps fumosorosea ARSEF 2679]|uniref:Glycosyltransferase family 17 n=1 Tax=Cordyceps fumosorosea (strain ARSEF 2679) TaxID=1081104 RepID=A0A162JHK0_CORFA|nr:glycosyltransferase family 17 [Cordyceps fumosorosea ARSEF 2679]OAA44438.1 glycosyltransferase family 17 [Cordyceps fumosorosea ARSEF 2679]
MCSTVECLSCDRMAFKKLRGILTALIATSPEYGRLSGPRAKDFLTCRRQITARKAASELAQFRKRQHCIAGSGVAPFFIKRCTPRQEPGAAPENTHIHTVNMSFFSRRCRKQLSMSIFAISCICLMCSILHLVSRQARSIGGLTTQNFTALCNHHGWPEFPRQTTTVRKVYDMFLINTEIDWLEIRLATLYPVVDYFIIVEASRTFTGLQKGLLVKESWPKFSRFHAKMVYHEVTYPSTFTAADAWETEIYTRNALLNQALQKLAGQQKPQQQDVLVVTDVDEVPKPMTLEVLRHCQFPRQVTLRSRFYYYSFQFLHRGVEWYGPKATFYEGENTVLPHDLRASQGLKAADQADMWNASWHCSSCFGTIEEFRVKMKSYSHTEHNSPQYLDQDWIRAHVRTGKDMWERPGEYYEQIADNTDVPPYILDNPKKYSYMLNRSGENAGFLD